MAAVTEAETGAKTLLLVGLGNPGAARARDRHNVGFMAADALWRAQGFPPFRARFGGLLSDGRINGARAIILKPMNFMNESGRAVGETARFFKLPPQSVFVFYDELDLPVGKIRVKNGGGFAGHNGARSLGQHIGPDFWRVRIGIDHPGYKDRVTGHVLSPFSAEEKERMDDLLGALARHAPLLAKDAATFANRVHLAMQTQDEV